MLQNSTELEFRANQPPKSGLFRDLEELLPKLPIPLVRGPEVFFITPKIDAVDWGQTSCFDLGQTDTLPQEAELAPGSAIVTERDIAEKPDDGWKMADHRGSDVAFPVFEGLNVDDPAEREQRTCPARAHIPVPSQQTAQTHANLATMTAESSQSEKRRLPRLYQLRVTVDRVQPILWRQIELEGDAPIDFVADAIRCAFGWSFTHAYKFVIKKRHYGTHPGDKKSRSAAE